MVWDKPDESELTDLDRKLIGPPRIITIPMEDRHLLREVGEMLAGLGRDMMFNATREAITTREVAAIVRNRINEVNQRIRNAATERGINMPRRGRRPSESREHEGNGSGTEEIVSFKNPNGRYNRNAGK